MGKTSTDKSSETKPEFRVITYNLLCSSLSNPNTHRFCNPKYLHYVYRFPQILRKLQEEVSRNSIICLQEVSLEWLGPLHVWFHERNYIMVNASYGTKLNGFMGIAMAWPIQEFESKFISIDQISGTRSWDSVLSSSKKLLQLNTSPSFIKNMKFPNSFFFNFFRKVVGVFTYAFSEDLFFNGKLDSFKDPWVTSQSRNNQMIFIKFKCKKTNFEFCVATYHMPCCFKCPKTMTIHTTLACQHAQKLASASPLVFAGDFNILPDSPQYNLVLKGKMDKSSPAYPKILGRETKEIWVFALPQPMKSAYKEFCSKEPDFTNWSGVNDSDQFLGTLDYVFFLGGLKVKEVVAISNRKQIKGGGPLPSKYEPSDHLMIGATFHKKK